MMLGICVLAGRSSVVAVSRPVADTTLVFLPRLAPALVDKPVASTGRAGGGGEEGGRDLVISANPPPLGFQGIDAVLAVPTFIPPVTPGERILDPRDFTGRGVEGGTGWGVVGGTGPADQTPIEGDGREFLYGAASKDLRFVPAVLTVQPVFDYPRVLRDAGIGGRVLLQFVIDTLGRVEPASIEVLETADQAFTESARSGMLEAQFRPAHYGDRPVRQLTKMPVSFRIGPEA
jgi:TonB family protein